MHLMYFWRLIVTLYTQLLRIANVYVVRYNIMFDVKR